MRIPRLTIQAKYLLVIAAVVSCASVVLSVYYYNAVKKREIEQLTARGRSMTISLALNSEEGVLFSDTQNLSLLVKLLSEDDDVVGAEITSGDGNALVSTATDLRFLNPSQEDLARVILESSDEYGLHLTRYSMLESDFQLLEFSAPITTRRIARGREEIGLMFGAGADVEIRGQEIEIGSARVIFSSARPFRELRKIQQNIIYITVAVAVAGILLTIPLVRLTVRPIRQLAEGTKRIAEGDLSQRVVASTRDEIGELADSFNQMAVDLEKYHEELKQHSRTLEERVRERTKDLELANAEIRKAQAQLIQAGKMTAMGEFGAGVAHELNQPLAGIKGYAQLLLSMVDEDSPLKSRLLQIDKQASRMKEITQTMWNLARQSNFEYSFVDIRQPINDSLILISEQFRQHQIEIVREIDEEFPKVYGDANQLHQVFLNFLTNAKDAVDESEGGRVKIRVAPIAGMRYVEVVVMDNGKGIPGKIVNDIFNPFFTTKAPGKGTGLGLSINYSIIEQHHGHVSVYSEKAVGTAFSVILPTEEFVSCSKNGEAAGERTVAPCWVADSESGAASKMRNSDCETCEIYQQHHLSPDTSLEARFREFIAEG
jgi:signal transduction histidine kinase